MGSVNVVPMTSSILNNNNMNNVNQSALNIGRSVVTNINTNTNNLNKNFDTISNATNSLYEMKIVGGGDDRSILANASEGDNSFISNHGQVNSFGMSVFDQTMRSRVGKPNMGQGDAALSSSCYALKQGMKM